MLTVGTLARTGPVQRACAGQFGVGSGASPDLQSSRRGCASHMVAFACHAHWQRCRCQASSLRLWSGLRFSLRRSPGGSLPLRLRVEMWQPKEQLCAP